MGKTCCFFGHSEIWAFIDDDLDDAVERHIAEHDVTAFLVGNYGQFDHMAARAVMAAKARHPGVRLELMLPYPPELGRALPSIKGYDRFIYPGALEGVPPRAAIPRLNRMMVDASDYAIAYVAYPWGGARKTLEYAQRRERQGRLVILNLGKPRG